jgi:hypothetical protein
LAPAATDFEQEIDRLYGLPLDEFVAARNELAKRAREEGERALATRIKELRKPNVSAWVINRLVRERELDIQRLLKAGERLAQAQVATVEGGDPEGFLEARRDEQRALAQLTKAARELVEREGHGVSAIEPITRSLRAAAVTEEGRELLKRGRLTEDVQTVGFEALSGVKPAQRKTRPQAQPKDGAARRRTVNEARRRLRELEAEAKRLERDAAAAERRAEKAEEEAAKLRAAAQTAREEADAAQAAVTRGREEVSQV